MQTLTASLPILFICGYCACGTPSPPAPAVEKMEDLGKLPLPSAAVMGRDGGQSGVLHNRLLWTFDDTFLSKKNSIDGSIVLSATSQERA
jgi:hypothetical protein